MDIRQITADYAVSPQITAEDLPAIKDAGFTTIICNRPDAEVPPPHQAAAIEAATQQAGLTFVNNPVTHQTLNMDMVAFQRQAMEGSSGPVLAYCASGTRSSIVWSLAQAGQMETHAIISATADAGYDLGGMRGQLDALSKA
ncbi:TIGR01244 family sulfur transferase [Loktanella agnita]|uniref:TIGR01244 family sulfur transferase n=1 Tax=Loktanella agnita TaxID=287097 RepID=UPI003987E82E